ncbi:MAG: RidA family protein [Bacteroidota bacterium]
MKKIIQTSKAPAPIGPYSQATQVGNLLFFSGQIAIDPSDGSLKTGDLDTETRQVMDNIGAILQSQNLNYSHIVKSSIFLKSMDDFAQINEIYGSYFSGDYPARETVQVARLPKDVNVEISVIVVAD